MWFHIISVKRGNNKGAEIKKKKRKTKTTTLAYISGNKGLLEQAKMWINECLCGQLVNLMLSDTSQRSRIRGLILTNAQSPSKKEQKYITLIKK